MPAQPTHTPDTSDSPRPRAAGHPQAHRPQSPPHPRARSCRLGRHPQLPRPGPRLLLADGRRHRQLRMTWPHHENMPAARERRARVILSERDHPELHAVPTPRPHLTHAGQHETRHRQARPVRGRSDARPSPSPTTSPNSNPSTRYSPTRPSPTQSGPPRTTQSAHPQAPEPHTSPSTTHQGTARAKRPSATARCSPPTRNTSCSTSSTSP